MQLEFHQLEMPYQSLRIHDVKRKARLLSSLSEHGQLTPVLTVKPSSENERYVLIDGYLRVAILKKIGSDIVSALVLEIDEISALCLSFQQEFNRRRTALEDAWLIRELIETYGVSQIEVAIKLGRSASWISRRLALIQILPERIQELVRQGKICPHGAMRYLVPLARANSTDCLRLVEHLGFTQVSTRQIEELYKALCLANDEERERIILQPHLYLKIAKAVAEPTPPPVKNDERLFRDDLELIGVIARRSIRRLLDTQEMQGHAPLVIHKVWQQTLLAFEELRAMMEQRIDVG